MNIPVYLFTGFLEAGKTTFAQETMMDPDFNTGERTLFLLCEEGEEEYRPAEFASSDVIFETITQECDLTLEKLRAYEAKHQIERVIVEYNGMWNLQTLYDALPKNWEIFQMLCIVDASTFPTYFKNMRTLTIDKLQEPEVVVFNRCTQETDRIALHRAVRPVNRRAQIIFEFTDGTILPDDFVEALRWDNTKDTIILQDDEFGIWYLDAMENPEKYEGREIEMRAYVAQSDRVEEGHFVIGRFAMTCCEDDIAYLGVLCQAEQAKTFAHRSWVQVRATIESCEHEIYEGRGILLKAKFVQPATPPQEELVYFFRD